MEWLGNENEYLILKNFKMQPKTVKKVQIVETETETKRGGNMNSNWREDNAPGGAGTLMGGNGVYDIYRDQFSFDIEK